MLLAALACCAAATVLTPWARGIVEVRARWLHPAVPRGLGAVLGAGAELLTEHSVETFGLGDVELALPLGLALGWHGWTTLVLGLLGGFVAFALAVLVLLAIRRTTREAQLPFGPGWCSAPPRRSRSRPPPDRRGGRSRHRDAPCHVNTR